MVGIVIVSHSAKVAEGICEMAAQMARVVVSPNSLRQRSSSQAG